MNKPQWMLTPNTYGLFYFAKNPKDWDLAKVVSVSKVETPSDIWCEVRIGNEYIRADDEQFKGGIWFGPLSGLERPSEEFLKQFDNPA
jgi:hypothetical protein